MKNDDMKSLQEDSYLEGDNLAYIESLYESFLNDPSSVDAKWQAYFKSTADTSDEQITPVREYFRELATKPRQAVATGAACSNETAVANLIHAYRSYGHHLAKLDPLNLSERHNIPELTFEYHGLSKSDFSTAFSVGGSIGKPEATLKTIYESLEATYCGSIGVEYMHITNTEEVKWLQSKMEPLSNKPKFDKKTKLHILDRLIAADGLEKYLGLKYVGQKRFSLEGSDSFVPSMDAIIRKASSFGVDECIVGMAHRGRLNMLVNVIGKAPGELFAEFEGKLVEKHGTGDVKYHKGFSSNIKLNGDVMHLALAFNPSHLEIVSPVVEGSVRARQRRRKDINREKVLPILVHGDAAMSGQGVVMETLNLSQARGFCTGGTVHVVINNQVGFTTSNPLDARSTLYCTDVAKMIQVPIFHVNGDDPEAVYFVSELAMDYRARFHKDVVVDLVSYRRQGHNEADDPSITQPIMYKAIKQLKTPWEVYADQLAVEGVIDQKASKQLYEDYLEKLDKGEPVVETVSVNKGSRYSADWSIHLGQSLSETVKTAVPMKRLQELAKKITTLPNSFHAHRQVLKLIEARKKMAAGDLPMDWGFAENMAYATLLNDGYPVRLCGQDSGRGTFSHRHAVLHDIEDKELCIPLAEINHEKAPFIVIDSVLSEEAVLAFEYGYSTADPEALDVWEAQFGDFANGAQVVIDQFISSGEQKWNRLSGLTMLLPHGYEGMGPEHSSARLERYLQLCAQQNMQVCVPTTPAQIFHLLRRQMIRLARKPLIVMSPKSLLRHKLAVSSMEDLAEGKFHLVIPEIDKLKSEKVKRVVVCSGKVYYDLLQKRREEKCEDVAIIRVEQLYPFPRQELSAKLKKYAKANDVVWCQEEPKNQGAWYQIMHHLTVCLQDNQTLTYTGRMALAAPSVGSAKRHTEEQAQLVNEALGL
jgi:2-oxoglutarate dehydrogenase E1 component